MGIYPTSGKDVGERFIGYDDGNEHACGTEEKSAHHKFVERLNEEVRRCERIIGVLPSADSMTRLLGPKTMNRSSNGRKMRGTLKCRITEDLKQSG